MRTTMTLHTITLLSVLGLAACGGGGGGGGGGNNPDPTPTPPPPAPVENFQLTGTISTSDSQAVDSDTNDPTRVVLSNDTIATAQPITNPVTLGGYLNEANSGAPGRSRGTGDLDDYFIVDLLEGQRITMLVADFESADADLYLYSEAGELIDFSLDTEFVENIVVPADGTYVVRAAIFFNATNYILAIGASGIADAAPARHEIVPFEAIVTYEDTLALNSASAGRHTLEQSMGLKQRGGGAGRNRLMAMERANVSQAMATARLGRLASIGAEITDPALRDRWETLQTIKTLRQDPNVRYAEPNYRVRALVTPNDEAFPVQWHYPLIGLPQAWETTTGDPNVIVAVVDTGILSNHPDLAGQLVSGYDFVSELAIAGDGNGIDPNPEEPADPGAGSEAFHGTHVLGTVAARGNNQIGVVGSAFSSRAMPLRALGVGGGGTSFDVEQAVRYAAGLPNDSNTVPSQTADIINLSLGGGGFSEAEQNLYNQVRQAGVMVVAAAGNEATTAPSYPAAYNNVISVSAVNGQRRITSYSNTGTTIDVAAPGGDTNVDFNGDGYPDGVLSTDGATNGNRINFVYRFLNGTSMAAPHVAGVLALMKSVNPDLTPEDVDALLEQGRITDDLGAPGRDNFFGHGLINAQLAVLAASEAAGNSPADDPRLVASSNSINFGVTATELQLGLRNRGLGDLAITAINTSEPWLAVAPLDVDGNGLGEYTVTVDRSGLSNGIYSAQITAQSTVNDVLVTVLVSVGGSGSGSDVGVLYVLLYDPVADLPVAEFQSTGDASVYPFQFFDIPPGDYEIIAGSDADNDLFICDAGEACGTYLTIDQPIRVTLDRDLQNLDFVVEFQVTAPTFSSLSQGEEKKESGYRRMQPQSEDGIRRQ